MEHIDTQIFKKLPLGESNLTSHLFLSQYSRGICPMTRMSYQDIRFSDWKIPQLIHFISIALEMCLWVDEFRDWHIFLSVWGEGSSGDSTVIIRKSIFRWIAAASFTLVLPKTRCHPEFFHKKINYLSEILSVEEWGISQIRTNYRKYYSQ